MRVALGVYSPPKNACPSGMGIAAAAAALERKRGTRFYGLVKTFLPLGKRVWEPKGGRPEKDVRATLHTIFTKRHGTPLLKNS